jgi:hypothetical protein
MMKDGVNFDYTQFPTAEAGGNSAPVSNLPWVQVRVLDYQTSNG